MHNSPSIHINKRSNDDYGVGGILMKLLLVGPGKMKIPNDGWGAIEIVIWQLKLHLEALGQKVDIFNQTGRQAAIEAQPWKYDFVHLHFDSYAPLWVELAEEYNFQLIVTSHHAFAPNLKACSSEYKTNIFPSLLKVKKHLALSQEIKETYRHAGCTGKIAVLHNGTEISEMKFSEHPGNGKAICLGRIGNRKQQAKLSQLINTVGGLTCDFVGPISDRKFTYNNQNTYYLGKWNRTQVHHHLTNYSCLLLPSKAEAHALVVLEALAAGLSVVVTPEASANLDQSLPFINVEKFSKNYIQIASQACRDNAKYRRQIRNYAEQKFDWKVVTKKYLQILKAWKLEEV
jgi:glycosyltransferase involved in cell wall biosynthesis